MRFTGVIRCVRDGGLRKRGRCMVESAPELLPRNSKSSSARLNRCLKPAEEPAAANEIRSAFRGNRKLAGLFWTPPRPCRHGADCRADSSAFCRRPRFRQSTRPSLRRRSLSSPCFFLRPCLRYRRCSSAADTKFPLITMSVNSSTSSELPDIFPTDFALTSCPYTFVPRGATIRSST